MEEKNIVIQVDEKYGDECLSDSVGLKGKNNRHPQGLVNIYEVDKDGKRQLVHKSNLVVYRGRETISQAILDTNNSSVPSSKEEHLYWLGLGDGGVDPSDPFNPSPPASTDTELDSKVPISATDTTCGDLDGGWYYKIPFDSVEFEQDSSNDDFWLIAKVTTTIKSGYANGYQLSEAGMYTALSNAPGYSPGSSNFHLFSKVTFPALVKTISRQLIFEWYLYF